MQKWSAEKTQLLKEILEKTPNPNVFEIAKQIKAPIHMIRAKIGSLTKGEETAFKYDPDKLSKEEIIKFKQIISQPNHPSAEELSKMFGKQITGKMIKKFLNPIFSEEDTQKVHQLFEQYKNTVDLEFYLSQFPEKKQHQFVISELTYITRKNRKEMPQKKKFWTEELKEKVLNLCKVHNNNYEKVCEELGLDSNYIQEIRKKHIDLTINRDSKSMEAIKKILKK